MHTVHKNNYNYRSLYSNVSFAEIFLTKISNNISPQENCLLKIFIFRVIRVIAKWKVLLRRGINRGIRHIDANTYIYIYTHVHDWFDSEISRQRQEDSFGGHDRKCGVWVGEEGLGGGGGGKWRGRKLTVRNSIYSIRMKIANSLVVKGRWSQFRGSPKTLLFRSEEKSTIGHSFHRWPLTFYISFFVTYPPLFIHPSDRKFDRELYAEILYHGMMNEENPMNYSSS